MNLGKGIYIWKIKEAEDGNISEIVGKSKVANFDHVLIKIANGIYGYNWNEEATVDLAKELSSALKVEGIAPWGWHYVFSDQPVKEAETAFRRIQETGVVGYIINAEGHSKGKYTNAQIFVNTLESLLANNGMEDFPIGLSSYRYPTYHEELPWTEFISICDIMIPQLYWVDASNPAYQVRKSLEEYRGTLLWDGPIGMTGSIYDPIKKGEWEPTVAQVQEFIDEVKAQGLNTINFWDWKHMKKDRSFGSSFWKEIIRDFEWTTSEEPTEPTEPTPTPEPDYTEILVQLEAMSKRLDKLSGTFLEFSRAFQEAEATIEKLQEQLYKIKNTYPTKTWVRDRIAEKHGEMGWWEKLKERFRS